MKQFGVINSCIHACFWLQCKLFHAAPTNICTLCNDPVDITVDEKGEDTYGKYHGNK